MTINLKDYVYHHGKNTALDAEFTSAAPYGKIKLGKDVIFWKVTLRWFALPLEKVQRVYRRVEEVNAKMCCGRANFDIQKLMLVLDEETTLELLISEGQEEPAVQLFAAIKKAHPELKYGKE